MFKVQTPLKPFVLVSIVVAMLTVLMTFLSVGESQWQVLMALVVQMVIAGANQFIQISTSGMPSNADLGGLDPNYPLPQSSTMEYNSQDPRKDFWYEIWNGK